MDGYKLYDKSLAPRRPEEGIGFLGTGVADGCEPPCGYRELNPGPLEEQPGLLTSEPPCTWILEDKV